MDIQSDYTGSEGLVRRERSVRIVAMVRNISRRGSRNGCGTHPGNPGCRPRSWLIYESEDGQKDGAAGYPTIAACGISLSGRTDRRDSSSMEGSENNYRETPESAGNEKGGSMNEGRKTVRSFFF